MKKQKEAVSLILITLVDYKLLQRIRQQIEHCTWPLCNELGKLSIVHSAGLTKAAMPSHLQHSSASTISKLTTKWHAI